MQGMHSWEINKTRPHTLLHFQDRELVEVKGIAGKENPADILTKLVPMSTIKEWKKQMDGGWLDQAISDFEEVIR